MASSSLNMVSPLPLSSSIAIKGTVAYVAAGVDDNDVENFTKRRRGEERVRIGDCLVDVTRIGLVCSMRSPVERMEMKDAVTTLCGVRDNFLKRTRDVGSS
ncbi:hypothetical protein LWI28_011092 [Acer negundo]|uniref:Uncharacterized protein n=1 Tax=Acer negundo TaxID=4023 RepID=A0AAD5I974_ACENE|nr:hypothetical protein LWI28_011092 [Acer negundo]